MTVANFRTAASRNLAVTYIRLAMASPKAEMWHHGNIEGCLGNFEHPICNFGVANRISLDDLPFLRELAASKNSFHLYVLPGHDSDVSDEILRRGGFRELYTLVEMIGPSEPQVHYEIPLQPLFAQASTRYQVGRFMADQFFPRQSEGYRDAIAKATEDAADLDLHAIYADDDEQNDLLAAVMLSREPALSEGSSSGEPTTLGIYNLCVDPVFQGMGIGRKLVSWALDQAKRESLIATLQCDPRLVSWYEGLGFWQTGLMRAYGLQSPLRG